MIVYLTEGMFGKRTSVICPETDKASDVLQRIFEWKERPENKAAYKIESYSRFLFDDTSIAVDFGDYSTFMLIENVSPEQKEELLGK